MELQARLANFALYEAHMVSSTVYCLPFMRTKVKSVLYVTNRYNILIGPQFVTYE